MLQLYKSRDFGLIFKDTFGFLKTHGKHFFKNYITVNGIFILILVTMTYMFYKGYEDIVMGGYVGNNNFNALENYLNENAGSVLLYGSIYIIVGIIVGVLNYAFVPIYFKLYEKHKGANFASKEIVDELIGNISKLTIFILVSILIAIPLFIVVGIIGLLMAITLIGIPFLIFLGALVSFFYHSTLMEYIKSDKKGIFECFGYSLNLCFKKFFPSLGAMGIFMLIVGIAQSVFSIAQLIIMMSAGVMSLENPNSLSEIDQWSTLFVILFILQILSYLFNLLTAAVIQMNQAIVYYSLKEEIENINTQNTIEQIGSAPD
ncbi:hypothetical protein H2O64_03990 [Kordia sp. YSTF-M3]|uniref:Glycerophosphoryl diester phosphodiesterase membrane domain-containing protein n=1 Tax=Kordia aestuariivivens TaxID=2759037 RepID=A0ABR7Q644_9FLAO|nr:hypothetical protein [Kordia aestuariivivens]MBC8753816.1 hypothetical protein [Kordia aestuariivivens]